MPIDKVDPGTLQGIADWLLGSDEKVAKGLGKGAMEFSPVAFAGKGLEAHKARVGGIVDLFTGSDNKGLSQLVASHYGAEPKDEHADLKSAIAMAPARFATEVLPIPDIVKHAIRRSPFYTGQDVEEFNEDLAQDIQGSDLADYSRLIAKWGPELMLGMGAYTRGGDIGVHLLRQAGVTAQGSAMLRTLPFSKTLQQQATLLAARVKDVGGARALLASTPTRIERGVQALGGGAGTGAYTSLLDISGMSDEEIEEVGLFGQMGSSFLLGFGLTVAFESLLIGGGWAFSRLAKPTRLREAAENFAETGTDEHLKAQIEALRTKRGLSLEQLESLIARQRINLNNKFTALQQAKELDRSKALVGRHAAVEGPGKFSRIQSVRPVTRGGKTLMAAHVPKKAAAATKAERRFKVAERKLASSDRDESGMRHLISRLDDAGDASSVNPFTITNGTPWNGKDHSTFVRQGLLYLLGDTIENWAGKLGVVGSKGVTWLLQSEADTNIARSINQSKLYGWGDSMHKELIRLSHTSDDMSGAVFASAAKLGKKLGKQEGQWARPIFAMAEEEGLDAVARGYSPKVASILKEIGDHLHARYEPIVAMGGKPFLNPAEYGVKMYMPQVMRQMPEKELKKQLMAAARTRIAKQNPEMSSGAVDVAAMNSVARHMNRAHTGEASFGSIDFFRYGRGSTSQKIAKGVPLENNPWVAIDRYMENVERRAAFGKRFGLNGELDVPLRNAVATEGGSEALFGNIMDTFYGRKYASASRRRLAQSLTGIQIIAKLPFAVIPNMTQSANTMAFAGMRNTWVGLNKMMKMNPKQKAVLARQVSATDDWFHAERRVWMGGADYENWIDRMVDRELAWTGFSAVERFNRKLGGIASYTMVMDDIGRGLRTGHRGRHLDAVRRRFEKVGLDYDDIVRRYNKGGQISAEEIDLAVYKGSQLTQFQPDVTRKPLWWTVPEVKVLSQFNSFALGQFQFMRNHVLAEAAHGNMRPIATILATYPIAGEFVGASLKLTGRGRDYDSSFDRVVDDFLLPGGVGIATSMYYAARYGRLQGILLGPTVTMGTELVEGITQIVAEGSGDKVMHQFKSEPIVRAGKLVVGAGIVTGEALMSMSEVMAEQAEDGYWSVSGAVPPGKKPGVTSGEGGDEKPRPIGSRVAPRSRW